MVAAGCCAGSARQRFKVAPIRRQLRALGVTAGELWLGISTDEIARAKPSNVKWLRHRWPLLELDLNRDACIAELDRRGLAVTKSACTFCPYHSPEEWRAIKANPRDWAAAVAYDEAVRDKRGSQGRSLFVHPARVPLAMAPIEDASLQDDLWGNECGGHCGL